MSAEQFSIKAAEGIPQKEGIYWNQLIQSALNDPATQILKDYKPRSSTITYRAILPDLGDVWLKKYRITKLRKIGSLTRRSRAQRVWSVTHRIYESGAPVPKLCLYCERFRWYVLDESFLVAEWLNERTPLSDFFRKQMQKRQDVSDALKSKMLSALKAAAEFHRLGVIHGDLKWSNFLLPMDSNQRIILVDLDASVFSKDPALRGKDLARFAISAIQHGLPRAFCEETFKTYKSFLQPDSVKKIHLSFDRYVRKKLPQIFS